MMSSTPISFRIATAVVKLLLVAANTHFFWRQHKEAHQRGSSIGQWVALVGMALGLFLLGHTGIFGWHELWNQRRPSVWHLAASVWTFGLFGGYCVWFTLRFAGWLRAQGTKKPGETRRPAIETMTRRTVINGLRKAAIAAPFAVGAYGTFIGRDKFQLREIEMAFPDLPPSLDGLRIAQITDIHAGPYLTMKEVERVVAMANETRPHLAVVTGDLITDRGDPLEQTIDRLAALKTDAGIWGCLGNHEEFAASENFTETYGRKKGLEFLRHRGQTLRFGDANLALSGVDYQSQSQAYLVGAEKLLRPDSFNLLLSHNPDVFPKAAALGYDLVLGGHTHGGQVTIEIVEQWANAGHFFTPFVAGEYRLQDSALYVSRGIGTVNLPMRIGALPEVTLVRLKRA